MAQKVKKGLVEVANAGRQLPLGPRCPPSLPFLGRRVLGRHPLELGVQWVLEFERELFEESFGPQSRGEALA